MVRPFLGPGRTHYGTGSSWLCHDHARRQGCNTEIYCPAGHRAAVSREGGRAKGGMNIRLHAVTDICGPPIRFVITAGHLSDHTGAAALINGQPKAERLLADRGNDVDLLRETLTDEGTKPCIPGRKLRKTPVNTTGAAANGTSFGSSLNPASVSFQLLATRPSGISACRPNGYADERDVLEGLHHFFSRPFLAAGLSGNRYSGRRPVPVQSGVLGPVQPHDHVDRSIGRRGGSWPSAITDFTSSERSVAGKGVSGASPALTLRQ
ncbi:Transposase DDE domain-containing protein [Sedimentitalea nanhaiensis]|uniref:Transposase DDE domain-containing protein n=1 Tax=Sedimentitalea nanhaiensis TaxID=999627 RepID=A0A1I7DFE7_9RHOB|nr:Transposase DDE domain-containing protein [Sedimentitalea nanhaiensis]